MDKRNNIDKDVYKYKETEFLRRTAIRKISLLEKKILESLSGSKALPYS